MLIKAKELGAAPNKSSLAEDQITVCNVQAVAWSDEPSVNTNRSPVLFGVFLLCFGGLEPKKKKKK